MHDRQTGATPEDDRTGDRDSLTHLLGGRTSAVDASLPPAAFGFGWFVSGHSIAVGGAVALAAGAAVGLWRWRNGARPLAVVLSLFAIMLGVVIALRTGHAADFFLIRLVSNATSALGWLASIVVRWPLLGLIVGTVLGQGRRWRCDPVLLRAYNRASLVWVGQYMLRLAVFITLWLASSVVGLAIAQIVLTWPLVAACLAVSWWVLRRTLPDDHPGLRHPQ